MHVSGGPGIELAEAIDPSITIDQQVVRRPGGLEITGCQARDGRGIIIIRLEQGTANSRKVSQLQMVHIVRQKSLEDSPHLYRCNWSHLRIHL